MAASQVDLETARSSYESHTIWYSLLLHAGIGSELVNSIATHARYTCWV
jgi:hypothetical protein